MIDRTNGTRGFVRKRAHECSSTRALEPSHSKTTRALELLHSSTRALELEKYSHTTRMTSANHSREFFHSRISSTRPVLYKCKCSCKTNADSIKWPKVCSLVGCTSHFYSTHSTKTMLYLSIVSSETSTLATIRLHKYTCILQSTNQQLHFGFDC